MKIKLLILLISISIIRHSLGQSQSLGVNNETPSPKASLDVSHLTGVPQGILVPRLPASDTLILQAGITSNERGLFFYDITNNVYRYWNGSKWNALAVVSASNQWQLTGNVLNPPDTSGAGLMYLGTQNAAPLIVSTNGVERLRISKYGPIGIGMMPQTNVRLSIKALGEGMALRLVRSASNVPLFGFSQSANAPVFDLFDVTGNSFIRLASDISYLTKSSLGIGTLNPLESLHILKGNLFLEGLVDSPSADYSGSILFGNGKDYLIGKARADNGLTIWFRNDPIWDESFKFSQNGEIYMGGVGGTYGFLVDKYGDLIRINKVSYSFPTSQGAIGSVLTNDGSGILSWKIPTPSSLYWQASLNDIYNTNVGNVGIGTTTPISKLHVSSNSSSEYSALVVNDALSGISGGALQVSSTGSRSIENNAMLIENLVTKSGGSNSTKVGLRINSFGSWGPGTVNQPNVGLWVDVDGADNNYAAIFNTGSVGIGTSSPLSQLSISGGLWDIKVNNGDIILGDANNFLKAGISFSGAGAGHAYIGATSALFLGTSTGTGTTASNDPNGYQTLTITGGNVGISTNLPTSKLDVNGLVRIRGGSPAAGKVLVSSDAEGNAVWRPFSKYTQKTNLSSSINNLTNTYTAFPASSFTVTKDYDDTVLEVNFNGRISVGVFVPTTDRMLFRIRVGSYLPTMGNPNGGIKVPNSTTYVSLYSVFTGLPAGTYTVVLEAAANNSGVVSDAVLDQDNLGGTITVKETY